MNIPEEYRCPFGSDLRGHSSFHVRDRDDGQSTEERLRSARQGHDPAGRRSPDEAVAIAEAIKAYRKDKIAELRAAAVV
jgi:hypothetical protein